MSTSTQDHCQRCFCCFLSAAIPPWSVEEASPTDFSDAAGFAWWLGLVVPPCDSSYSHYPELVNAGSTFFFTGNRVLAVGAGGERFLGVRVYHYICTSQKNVVGSEARRGGVARLGGVGQGGEGRAGSVRRGGRRVRRRNSVRRAGAGQGEAGQDRVRLIGTRRGEGHRGSEGCLWVGGVRVLA